MAFKICVTSDTDREYNLDALLGVIRDWLRLPAAGRSGEASAALDGGQNEASLEPTAIRTKGDVNLYPESPGADPPNRVARSRFSPRRRLVKTSPAR